MIQAPVGFQCLECVQAAAPPQQRTVAGGSLITKPYVTYTLIGINAVVFAIQYIVGIDVVAKELGMWPIGVAIGGEWWRLASAAFLHGSLLHIGFNMYVLYVLGPTLERILGHARFIILYALAAFGGAVASYVLSDVRTVSVGASGAIFGLMGALVIAGQRLRYDIRQVLILLAINVVIGFIAPNVDWRAHLGGLVVGAVVAAIMVLPKRKHRMAIQVFGLVSVSIVLAVVAAWRTSELIDTYGPFITIN
jgi:membrane associated rhomboid family serine protease